MITSVTDVSKLEQVESLAEQALAAFGAVDVVVNNAGVIAWNPIDALTIGDWRWVVDVNLWGVIHGVHVFLPILESQGTDGHIVNVSSIGGVLADVPFMGTYSATKAALSRELDMDLAGAIEYEAMTQALLMHSTDFGEFYAAWRDGRKPAWSGQ